MSQGILPEGPVRIPYVDREKEKVQQAEPNDGCSGPGRG